MQNVQLEAINEEDEHSERAKYTSKLAQARNSGVHIQKSQASKSMVSQNRSSRQVSVTNKLNDSSNNNND